MHKLYCDDTAFKKQHDESHGPIFLYGGVLISRKDEIELSQFMKEIKKQYTSEDMPIKYNILDVEKIYKQFEREEEHKKLKTDSIAWRNAILSKAIGYDIKIFVSCIENFQGEKKGQKLIKEDLSSFLFANTLMRVGLYVAEKKIDYTQVILDWPSSGQPQPFDKEYYYAYNRGTSFNGQRYFCNELKNLGFDQTLYYARCHHSNILQLTDIIMGATRDWMETEFDKREFSNGKEFTKIFLPKFYGYPDSVFGYGINVSSNNLSFRSFVRKIIKENVA